MEIEYCGRTFNMENMNSYSSVIEYLDNIEGATKLEIDESKIKKLPRDKFVEFDMLTQKETAIVNLLLSMVRKRYSLMDKLFPPNEELIEVLTRALAPDKEITPRNIDSELWMQLNKLNHLLTIVQGYIEFNLYNRLGFEIFISYETDGKVLALKNLADIPPQPRSL